MPDALDCSLAADLAREHYGIAGSAQSLPGYLDRNFLITAEDGTRWVLKVVPEADQRAELELQNAALERLQEREPGLAPSVRTSRGGREIEEVALPAGRALLRLLSFIPGPLLGEVAEPGPATWRSLGRLLARVDRALEGLEHPALDRALRWDLARTPDTLGRCGRIRDARRRELVQRVQVQFQADVARNLDRLPRAVIHNDANDANLVVSGDPADPGVVALFDFGDMLRTARIFELAVAGAYAVMDREDPLAVLGALVAGYGELVPIEALEADALFTALRMRLVQSVLISAEEGARQPDNAYVRISEAPAWRTLERLSGLDPARATRAVRDAAGLPSPPEPESLEREEVLRLRAAHLGPALSLSYESPLEITRGRMQFLFDKTGRAFLDCVNNVCHVGHCHPRVVAAITEQAARLNTNTRYLHDTIVRYARRLVGLLPDPLEVCWFVNSGSEANELALRLARAATGLRDMLVVESGYHGNTGALIDLSPYKHDGPGGRGAPDWVHTVPCPDTYRGRYREADAAERFAAHVAEACERARGAGRGIAGFLAEPLIGCGGQVVPPDGWLRRCFEHARAAGAVCIADEVQVGLGRVGTHLWAFEAQGAVPDIVTLGKPIGNGHPLGAVVTTRAIADAFAGGMEFFSTFGGNPVSCAAGMAVLDVLEEEQLQENASKVGDLLLAGFRELAARHPCIGDVRGLGLYLGIELVTDRETREPAPDLVSRVLEDARHTGVLLSSDGPDHDVLKVKPPLPFSHHDADLLLAVLDRALRVPGSKSQISQHRCSDRRCPC